MNGYESCFNNYHTECVLFARSCQNHFGLNRICAKFALEEGHVLVQAIIRRSVMSKVVFATGAPIR